MAPELERVLRDINLDAEMQRGSKHVTFSRDVEAIYRQDTLSWRCRHLRRAILMALISYNIFLIVDYVLVPDAFLISAALHLMIVTPIMLLIVMILSRLERPGQYDLIGILVPLIYLAQVEVVFLLSRAPDASHYQYHVLFAVLFTNTILRTPFRYALALTVLITLAHVGIAAFLAPHLSRGEVAMATMALMGVSYMTLISNATNEGQHRRSWLLRRVNELRSLDLKRDNVKLSQLSRIDPLTGVANRRGFELAVEQFTVQQKHRDTPFCIIMLDVDHFKSYNDTYGHGAGDACLHMMAQVMGESVRGDHDVLARFGGEEFIIFVANCYLNDGALMAERIRRAVVAAALPHARKDGGTVVTVSLGVSEGRLSGAAALHEIMAHADAALYDAKRAGRNRVEPPPQLRPGFMFEDKMPTLATAELF